LKDLDLVSIGVDCQIETGIEISGAGTGPATVSEAA
jgi:hypothetical protein